MCAHLVKMVAPTHVKAYKLLNIAGRIPCVGNNSQALLARSRELEAEQSALWCKISFHAVASRDLLSKPLYRNDLRVDGKASAESNQRLEALRAGLDFLRNGHRLAAMVEQGVDADAARCYSQLQTGLETARGEMQQRLMAQPALAGDLANRGTSLGQLAAVAKRMSDVSANITDAYRLAMDGDRAGDKGRKLTFRRELQQSLMLCAESLMAGDECVTVLAQEWTLQPAAQTKVAPVSEAVKASLTVPKPVIQEPKKEKDESPVVFGASESAPRPSSMLLEAPSQAPQEVKDLFSPAFAALSPDERYNRVIAKMKELNPGLTGDITCEKTGAEVTRIDIPPTGLTSLWPLRALTSLRELNIFKKEKWEKPRTLQSEVTDLSPLSGLQLVSLNCGRSKVSDLSPLKGMPLQKLYINRTKVVDLTPLIGMPLQRFSYHNTRVVDVSPLKDMHLLGVSCSFDRNRDGNILRSMTSLERINHQSAEDFWKAVDVGNTSQDPDGANE